MESEDGLHFTKPLDVATGTGNSGTKGTNVVLQEYFDGNVVWLDHHPKTPSERWKMATVPANLGFEHMHLLTSPDGIHWQSRLNGSGPLLDRSTFWYDSLRGKWIFSLKQEYKSPYGRSRGYVEADDFIAGANWSQAEIYPWTSADDADPTWPYNDHLPAQLYTLDGAVYESLTVGLFSLFRGFVNEGGTSDGRRTSAEHDELYLGFSRDSFHWWRQYDGNYQQGGETPRKPFMAQAWPLHSYRYSGVQSVGGGLNLGRINGEERLLFYASMQSGLPFDPGWTGGNSSMGVASLRRDGFTSVEAMMSGSPGTLTTRPLIFNANMQYLFVNLVVQPGGFFQVAVLDAQSNATMTGFEGNHSIVGPLKPSVSQGCVPDTAPAFDSTRAAVSWLRASPPANALSTPLPPLASLASVAGQRLRLQFRFAAASLYSFWVSESKCGASGGVVGAGGPGTVAGRDVHGSCAPPL